MQTRHCKFCNAEHPDTAEFWLRRGNHFQCRGRIRVNARKWHIDHVVPLSSFDLSDPEQFRRAVHFSNLQPLWQDENVRKGGRGK